MNSQITAILALGADAMDNLFDVYITLPPVLETSAPAELHETSVSTIETRSLRLRVAGFEPPAFKTKMYDVRYKTVSVKRPAPIIDGAREFKLTFRIDAYYDVYLMLAAWRNLLYTPATGYASNYIGGQVNGALGTADESTLGVVRVIAVRGPLHQAPDNNYVDDQGIAISGSDVLSAGKLNTSGLLGYGYKDVWLSDLDEPKFKTGGGEAQSVTATFQFGDFFDPLTARLESTAYV